MPQVPPQPVIPSNASDPLFPRVNAIFLSAPKKSLRQIPPSRYNRFVGNYVQAPTRAPVLFLVTHRQLTPVSKLFILNDLRTLKIVPFASHSFLDTCALSSKHPGVYPKASHFGTHTTLQPGVTPPCSRGRLPDRGPLQLFLAPLLPTEKPSPPRCPAPRSSRRSGPPKAPTIFTCNKKAIYPTIAETHPVPTTLIKYSVPIFRRLAR
jgi:hypothetical protein